jgi:hypothetical protein
MKLAKSVLIAGQKIKVKLVADLQDADGKMLWGVFYADANLICIDQDAPHVGRVFFHECCHAALAYTGANIGLSTEREEQIVTALEYALFDLVAKMKDE